MYTVVQMPQGSSKLIKGWRKEFLMLYYALMFLVLGLVAAALGFAGIAGVATQISWVLFVVGVVLLIIHLVLGRSPRGI
jgi:uncharacterized membrane protein YtjA (UPF0391 family)